MYVSDKFNTDPRNHEITAKFGVLILGFIHLDPRREIARADRRQPLHSPSTEHFSKSN